MTRGIQSQLGEEQPPAINRGGLKILRQECHKAKKGEVMATSPPRLPTAG